jgi:hypothetical protein
MNLPKPPDWQKTFPGMPKLPDMKRFQRTFQGFQGKGQGAWGKYANYFRNLASKGSNDAKR